MLSRLTLCGLIFQSGLSPRLPLARARIPLSVLRLLRGAKIPKIQ